MTYADRIEHRGTTAIRVRRVATQHEVPVPSVLDALGIHHVNRVLSRAGYGPDAPWWPEEGKK